MFMFIQKTVFKNNQSWNREIGNGPMSFEMRTNNVFTLKWFFVTFQDFILSVIFSHILRFYTERFTDLGKLNLVIVVWFWAQANLYFCPSCLKKQCSVQKWSKLTQK